jgi:phospholipase A1
VKVKMIYLAWLASGLFMINGSVYGDEMPVDDDMMNDVPFYSTSGTMDSGQTYTDTVQELSIESDHLKRCLAQQMRDAPSGTTVDEVRDMCRDNVGDVLDLPKNALARRYALESEAQWNPYAITAHKQNYILPLTYATGLNDETDKDFVEGEQNSILDNEEAKFQLSLKIPLNYSSMFVDGDSLHFGFTLQSYWQVYNDNESAPFRETNYQPEVFYMMPLEWNVAGGDTGLTFGMEHQSNGRNDPISRRWNRIYTTLLWADENMVMSLKAWYRIPEDNDDDDNPDINSYMGYFEHRAAYKMEHLTFSTMFRGNPAAGHGAFELGMSFPIWGRLNGYVQYFNGYGESLIDYDNNIERFGVGILLTDLL